MSLITGIMDCVIPPTQDSPVRTTNKWRAAADGVGNGDAAPCASPISIAELPATVTVDRLLPLPRTAAQHSLTYDDAVEAEAKHAFGATAVAHAVDEEGNDGVESSPSSSPMRCRQLQFDQGPTVVDPSLRKNFDEAFAAFLSSQPQYGGLAAPTLQSLRAQLLKEAQEKAHVESELRSQLEKIRQSKAESESALQRELLEAAREKVSMETDLRAKIDAVRRGAMDVERALQREILAADVEQSQRTGGHREFREAVQSGLDPSVAAADLGLVGASASTAGVAAGSSSTAVYLEGLSHRFETIPTADSLSSGSTPVTRPAASFTGGAPSLSLSVASTAQVSGSLEDDLIKSRIDQAMLNSQIVLMKKKLEESKTFS